MDNLGGIYAKLEYYRLKAANNNLKVSVFSLYIDLINYIRCFAPYLKADKVELLIRRIEVNVNDVLENHHLSMGLHSLFVNNTKKEIDADLLKADIDEAVIEEVKYNNLVRSLKDRVLLEVGNSKDSIVAKELIGLLGFLSEDVEYNSNTIKALENLLIKYATYVAKSKHKDGSARSTIRKAINEVKESVETKGLKK